MPTNILLNKTATASGYVAPFSPDRVLAPAQAHDRA